MGILSSYKTFFFAFVSLATREDVNAMSVNIYKKKKKQDEKHYKQTHFNNGITKRIVLTNCLKINVSSMTP